MLTVIKCADCYLATDAQSYKGHIIVRCPFIDKYRQISWPCKFNAKIKNGSDSVNNRKSVKACEAAYNRWLSEQEDEARRKEGENADR